MPAKQKTAAPKTARKSSSSRKSPAKPAARKRAKPAARKRATSGAHTRFEHNGRVIGRVKDALERTQKEMTAIRGSIGTGGKDLRKDVSKMLRDVRRDVEKMNRTVVRDLERVQKDLSPTAKPKRARKASVRRPSAARGRRRRAA